jgi:hypothetical protein
VADGWAAGVSPLGELKKPGPCIRAGDRASPRQIQPDLSISQSKNGTMSSATTFKILIIGLMAGPAVSL